MDLAISDGLLGEIATPGLENDDLFSQDNDEIPSDGLAK
jgi:hypothetical protein